MRNALQIRQGLGDWLCRSGRAVLLAAMALAIAGCNRQGASPGTVASAETYPRRAVTLICPWAPGGGTDRVARFIAEQLQRELGKPVVVVNRTGGSGAVGHTAAAQAEPDGHTLLLATFELSTMHWMGISPLTWTNFVPVYQLNADAAALVARTNAPWRTLPEFLAHVKANPGKVKMSGTATGGAWDLARAGLLLTAGLPVNAVMWIPAQGSAPSLVELLGGHIDVVCCSLPEALSQLEAGQLRALGVMAGERLAQFPEVPTAREAGVVWEAVGWRGLMVPRGTSPGVVTKLEALCRKITEAETYREFMNKNGFAVVLRGAEAFGEFLRVQDEQWGQVIEKVGYAKGPER